MKIRWFDIKLRKKKKKNKTKTEWDLQTVHKTNKNIYNPMPNAYIQFDNFSNFECYKL